MNISMLSLKALRDQINAGTREVTFKTDDGSMTQMVYIPRFIVPAGIWENGDYPSKDLELGGFFIDKYQCSHKAATSKTRGIGSNPTIEAHSESDVAVSLPGKIPWTQISFSNAVQAVRNRTINGIGCHLVTMEEWATMAFLIKILGHDIRGNNYKGRDYRDSDSFEMYGVKHFDNHDFCTITGTGPSTWAHNGQANGVFDLVGNIWEFVDFICVDTVYTHIKKARISDSDGISSTDTAIVVDNIEDLQNWSAPNLILVKSEGANTDEYIRYTSIIDNGDGTATLSGCQRGLQGTNASPHADNAEVNQLTNYCLVPGGAKANLVNSVDDTVTTIKIDNILLGPGGEDIDVGDWLYASGEEMVVTANNGNGYFEVIRGGNDSRVASHAAGDPIVKVPNYSTSKSTIFGHFHTLRSENDLVSFALPGAGFNQTDDYKDAFWISPSGERVARRGGYWNNSIDARSAFSLDLTSNMSSNNIYIGFRAALSL